MALAAVLGAAALAAAFTTFGRGGEGSRPRPRAASAPAKPVSTLPPTTVVGVATPPVRDPRRGNGEPVTFAFGGDVHFEAGLRQAVLADPSGEFLAPIAPTLQAADIAMVNLETPVTDRDTPVEGHTYVFRAPPAAFPALRAAGVDVVTMANNHAADHGVGGITDSLAAAQAAGFPLVGLGADATQAFAPWRTEVRGQRVAVIAATDVFEGPVATTTQPGVAVTRPADQLLVAVRAARGDSDTIVVYLHWGVEGDTCPSPEQELLARQLVDAGADIVVGAHAHRQQGAGHLGSAFVAYGLGNFVWYNESGDSGTTGVLRVTATGRDVDDYTWIPARIRQGVPNLLTGPDGEQALAEWNELRACTSLTP